MTVCMLHLLLNTCIIHVKMAQHVYTKMLEFTLFKHNFPHAKITDYGQILYNTILESLKHNYHQDYYVLNHARGLYIDVYCMGSFTL